MAHSEGLKRHTNSANRIAYELPSLLEADTRQKTFTWDEPKLHTELHNQGAHFEIPSEYQNQTPLRLEKPQYDRNITGLLVETPEVRAALADKIATAVAKGISVTCVYSDLDQLKSANNKGRNFGDFVIQYGAGCVLQALTRANLTREGIEVIVTRQTDAADETVIFAFGLQEQEIERLQTELAKADAQKHSDEVKFDFSSSTALVTLPKQGELQQRAFSDWLKKNPTGKFTLFQNMKDTADTLVKEIKVKSDLKRRSLIAHETNLDTFVHAITTHIGNSRLSKEFLGYLLHITNIKTTLAEFTEEPGVYPYPINKTNKQKRETKALESTILDLQNKIDTLSTSSLVYWYMKNLQRLSHLTHQLVGDTTLHEKLSE